MIRGFLSGVFWGGAVAALGLAAVSQLTPLPVARIEATASAVPRPKATPVEPATAPEAVVPDATAQTAPATQDMEPPAGSEFAKPLPDSDPVLPAADAVPGANTSPVAPLSPLASDQASATAVPSVAPKTGFEAPDAFDALIEEAETKLASPAEQSETTAMTVPGQLALPEADAVPSPAPDPAPPLPPREGDALLMPVPENQLVQKPAKSPDMQPDQVLGLETDIAPIAPAQATLEPTPGLKGNVDGVTTGRLPRIGDPAPAADGGGIPTEGKNPEGLTQEFAGDPPPLEKYARPFENPESKPLFAIILIDTGGDDVNRAELAALPFPVTFALDPLSSLAAQASKIYRDAGQEVIMVATGIPTGATASDLEVTFAANAAALPEAVAVIDTEFGAFQADRPLATQVVPILKSQGRGLISWDRGLNVADQVARREGLASGMVFRKLDGNGENKAAVRRALDRAAFKAAQEGRVLVIGQTLQSTMAALTQWAGEARAASVALAPVSAVLSTQ